MPCYLFTWHGHGTWWPDDPRGYVHRQKGLQPTSAVMGGLYREQQRDPTVHFTTEHQRALIDHLHEAAKALQLTIHGVGTDMTHVHVLLSWPFDRDWRAVHRALRRALSLKMNERFGRRRWFSEGGSRKRVRDYAHLDHLLLRYLPKHQGVVWIREQDRAAAERRAGIA
jgi:hypothetical protein